MKFWDANENSIGTLLFISSCQCPSRSPPDIPAPHTPFSTASPRSSCLISGQPPTPLAPLLGGYIRLASLLLRRRIRWRRLSSFSIHSSLQLLETGTVSGDAPLLIFGRYHRLLHLDDSVWLHLVERLCFSQQLLLLSEQNPVAYLDAVFSRSSSLVRIQFHPRLVGLVGVHQVRKAVSPLSSVQNFRRAAVDARV